MIAVIMNLISVIMLGTGLVRSDDKSVAPGENHSEDIPIGSDQLPSPSAQYNSASDRASVF